MGAWNFEQLKQHIGHKIVCVGYGREETVNVAIECEDCNEVLFDFDKDEEDEVTVKMDLSKVWRGLD